MKAEEPRVTKVWVLMGGEGLQRQQSIRSGLHACLMMQSNPELQVGLRHHQQRSISSSLPAYLMVHSTPGSITSGLHACRVM